MATIDTLLAIGPMDGRYRSNVPELEECSSEFGLIKRRVLVEILYFLSIAPLCGYDAHKYKLALEYLHMSFTLNDAKAIKRIEKRTNHDVKAVEYWIRNKARKMGFPKELLELFHFALTSEDINNIAYTMMAQDGLNILVKELNTLLELLDKIAEDESHTVMMGRTHLQPAIPTTYGKEIRVFADRLGRTINEINNIELPIKLNGATGTYAAHVAAMPDIDWIKFTQEFVNSLGFISTIVTTQIEPQDTMCNLFDALSRANSILTDLCQDMRLYAGFGLIKLRKVDQEVGSSTMSWKINPIDFENATTNLAIANSFFGLFSEKLPISWLQRDLTNSTLLRNIGLAYAYALQSYKSIRKGLGKVQPDREHMLRDVMDHPEIITEAIQTVLRLYGIPNGYERMKKLSRGNMVTLEDLRKLIRRLPIPTHAKESLLGLRPEDYIGLAGRLAIE